jgi:hypothetical protein
MRAATRAGVYSALWKKQGVAVREIRVKAEETFILGTSRFRSKNFSTMIRHEMPSAGVF